MDWRKHIVTDPDVAAGKPVVRGTRLAVDFVLGLFAAGWTEAQVLQNYPALTAEALAKSRSTRLSPAPGSAAPGR